MNTSNGIAWPITPHGKCYFRQKSFTSMRSYIDPFLWPLVLLNYFHSHVFCFYCCRVHALLEQCDYERSFVFPLVSTVFPTLRQLYHNYTRFSWSHTEFFQPFCYSEYLLQNSDLYFIYITPEDFFQQVYIWKFIFYHSHTFYP